MDAILFPEDNPGFHSEHFQSVSLVSITSIAEQVPLLLIEM